MLLRARTIRVGANLGPARIAVQRIDPLDTPTKLYMAYIEGGQAKVATSTTMNEVPTQWNHEYTLTTDFTTAIDIDIKFDGAWERTPDGRYTLYTIGDPWVAMVSESGELTVQQGKNGDSLVLAPDGVTKVSMVRGWKNIQRWDQDHGIVVAYIRNGVAYYRNYAQQPPDLPAIWEVEDEIGLPSPTKNIDAFRTNDYRVGVIGESNGKLYWTVLDPNWAGMALPSHTITAGDISVSVDLVPLDYIGGFTDSHTITASVNVDVETFWAASFNAFIDAENDGNFTVVARHRYGLLDLTAIDFEIRDADESLFSITDIEEGEGKNEIIFATGDLGFSRPGNLTLKFLGSGNTKGEIGQNVDPFEITFTPIGIEYAELDPPQVEVMWNE